MKVFVDDRLITDNRLQQFAGDFLICEIRIGVKVVQVFIMTWASNSDPVESQKTAALA